MFKVIIPARYASSRLPGKPLCEIHGKPLIQHVWERAQESGAEAVIIAADDERVKSAAERFGAQVCMTSSEHRSGTERIAEVLERLGERDDTIIVNLQGDEPQLPGELIGQVASLLQTGEGAAAATLCEPIPESAELLDPNVVKVVLDGRGFALYFSRAPIPWDRDAFASWKENKPLPVGITYYRHIGLYAYRAAVLKQFAKLGPCPMETVERLEQLRFLYHGHRIRVAQAARPSGVGVDTPQDLERLRAACLQPEA
ncbi:MAG: 3-deoxy-manno-octulosonate cytidylyltransferase [Gammaproteobacteria bacterium]